VNGANAKMAAQTGSRRGLSVVGVILCLAALVILIVQTAITTPSQLWILAGMVGLSFLIEGSFRVFKIRPVRASS